MVLIDIKYKINLLTKKKVFIQQIMGDNKDELVWRSWISTLKKGKEVKRLMVVGKYRIYFIKTATKIVSKNKKKNNLITKSIFISHENQSSFFKLTEFFGNKIG